MLYDHNLRLTGVSVTLTVWIKYVHRWSIYMIGCYDCYAGREEKYQLPISCLSTDVLILLPTYCRSSLSVFLLSSVPKSRQRSENLSRCTHPHPHPHTHTPGASNVELKSWLRQLEIGLLWWSGLVASPSLLLQPSQFESHWSQPTYLSSNYCLKWTKANKKLRPIKEGLLLVEMSINNLSMS